MSEAIKIPKIRIVGDGPYGRQIYLDDIDISNFVNRVEFVLDAMDAFPTVKLIIVGLPDIPENLQSIITAEKIDPEELIA